MRQDALSELSNQLDEGYEKFSKDLSINIDSVIQKMTDMETNLGNVNTDANNALLKFLGTFNSDLTTVMSIGTNSISTDLEENMDVTYDQNEAIENEKAQKLYKYETDKINAMKDMKNSQAKRDEITQFEIENFRIDQEIQNKSTNSYFEDLKASQSNIQDLLNRTNDYIQDTIKAIHGNTNDNVVDMLQIASSNLEEGIEDYFENPANEFRSTVDKTEAALSSIKEALIDQEYLKDQLENTIYEVGSVQSVEANLNQFLSANGTFKESKATDYANLATSVIQINTMTQKAADQISQVISDQKQETKAKTEDTNRKLRVNIAKENIASNDTLTQEGSYKILGHDAQSAVLQDSTGYLYNVPMSDLRVLTSGDFKTSQDWDNISDLIITFTNLNDSTNSLRWSLEKQNGEIINQARFSTAASKADDTELIIVSPSDLYPGTTQSAINTAAVIPEDTSVPRTVSRKSLIAKSATNYLGISGGDYNVLANDANTVTLQDILDESKQYVLQLSDIQKTFNSDTIGSKGYWDNLKTFGFTDYSTQKGPSGTVLKGTQAVSDINDVKVVTKNSSGDTVPYTVSVRELAPNMDKRVLDAFEQLGWKVVVDKNLEGGSAVTQTKKARIVLDSERANYLYHELGHFVAMLTGDTDLTQEFKSIYNDEKSKFAGTFKAYASSSSSEYFAEAMKEYINDPNKLRQNTPRTYQAIKNALDAINADVIARFQNKYAQIWEKYRALGYASGTLNASKGIHQVFEQGPEIITTPKGTFIPFNGGEGVVPAKQTQTLLNLANGVKNGMLKLQMPDMSAYKIPELRNNVTNNNQSIYFDSLITINGNADRETVEEIRQIAHSLVNDRRFQENVTEFVSRRQAQDGRMAGKRTSIR